MYQAVPSTQQRLQCFIRKAFRWFSVVQPRRFSAGVWLISFMVFLEPLALAAPPVPTPAPRRVQFSDAPRTPERSSPGAALDLFRGMRKKRSLEETCQLIGGKLGSVSIESCLGARLRLSGGYSLEGIPIAIREYPPLPERTPQARVLMLGGIHGDEFSSISIVFRWMKLLDRHHSGRFHWLAVPLVNPDGLLRPKSQRINHNGVDLNRNFPTRDWARKARGYWEGRTRRDRRRYPGPYALSEPESRWVVKKIRDFMPDVIISIHAPLGLLDFDGPPTSPPEKLGHLYLSLLGTFPGSLGRFAGEELGIPVITIELPLAGIMPTKSEIQSIWVDLINWLSDNVHRR